ncbi:MAG: HEAT repeat domain-containing protein [Candidatus Aminicenantaceae bacterium]
MTKAAPPESKMEAPAREAVEKIKSTSETRARLKLLQDLIKIPDPWVSDVLLDCLDEANETIRDLIIKSLSEREDLDLGRVYLRLTALHWYVKSGSLRILGFRRDPLSVKRIEAILTDPNTDVRMQAAWALGEIGGDESLALLARLAKDRNNFVRMSAERALQKASDLKFT